MKRRLRHVFPSFLGLQVNWRMVGEQIAVKRTLARLFEFPGLQALLPYFLEFPGLQKRFDHVFLSSLCLRKVSHGSRKSAFTQGFGQVFPSFLGIHLRKRTVSRQRATTQSYGQVFMSFLSPQAKCRTVLVEGAVKRIFGFFPVSLFYK